LALVAEASSEPVGVGAGAGAGAGGGGGVSLVRLAYAIKLLGSRADLPALAPRPGALLDGEAAAGQPRRARAAAKLRHDCAWEPCTARGELKLRCARCKAAFYCGAKPCQHGAFPSHKFLCPILKQRAREEAALMLAGGGSASGGGGGAGGAAGQ
jgi:hypothetical protein